MSPRLSYKHWKSTYDGQWHAFPTAQADDPTRAFLQALCEHSVPVQQVERISPPDMASLCQPCLWAVSEQEGDPNAAWRGR